jgi:hypothetical protein
MTRPVERFPVEIETRPGWGAEPKRGAAGRAGAGPVGLAATACLGAALTLLAQRLAADGRLVELVAGLLGRLAG